MKSVSPNFKIIALFALFCLTFKPSLCAGGKNSGDKYVQTPNLPANNTPTYIAQNDKKKHEPVKTQGQNAQEQMKKRTGQQSRKKISKSSKIERRRLDLQNNGPEPVQSQFPYSCFFYGDLIWTLSSHGLNGLILGFDNFQCLDSPFSWFFREFEFLTVQISKFCAYYSDSKKWDFNWRVVCLPTVFFLISRSSEHSSRNHHDLIS